MGWGLPVKSPSLSPPRSGEGGGGLTLLGALVYLCSKLIFLKVLCRLDPPSFTHILTSAWSWPGKLDPQLPLQVLCRFMTLTTPTHYRAFNGQGSPTRERSSRLRAAYKARNGVPRRWKDHFLHSFVQESKRTGHLALTTPFLYSLGGPRSCDRKWIFWNVHSFWCSMKRLCSTHNHRLALFSAVV